MYAIRVSGILVCDVYVAWGNMLPGKTFLLHRYRNKNKNNVFWKGIGFLKESERCQPSFQIWGVLFLLCFS